MPSSSSSIRSRARPAALVNLSQEEVKLPRLFPMTEIVLPGTAAPVGQVLQDDAIIRNDLQNHSDVQGPDSRGRLDDRNRAEKAHGIEPIVGIDSLAAARGGFETLSVSCSAPVLCCGADAGSLRCAHRAKV